MRGELRTERVTELKMPAGTNTFHSSLPRSAPSRLRPCVQLAQDVLCGSQKTKSGRDTGPRQGVPGGSSPGASGLPAPLQLPGILGSYG